MSGVPNRLLWCIERLYNGGTTRLKLGRQMGSAFKVGRGLDRATPVALLFNFVIDYVLSQLDLNLGIALAPEITLIHLAFADDVVLLSVKWDCGLLLHNVSPLWQASG
jgi:hypothetical protein